MKIISVIFLFATYLILYATASWAANMESNRYRIKAPNINIGAKDQSSSNYDLGVTMGQTAAGQFNSTGYIIKAGFQYIHSIIPFTFSISNININLGTLTANTPVTGTTTLTVSFGSAGQYQVTAAERGPLQTLNGANNIVDTNCNGGGSACDESNANVWNSSSAYGFGYNMSGTDIPADFVNSTYYRPFPDTTAAETPATVMSNSNVGTNRQSTVTFKANISPIQAAGSYQTIISFVATPSF